MAQRQIAAFGPLAHFYECPRWHDGRWWASDMRGGTVYSFSPNGEAHVELEVDDRPAGLGWTLDGRLLVVSMQAKQLLRRAPDGAAIEKTFELAPLFGETDGFLNDLAVSPTGHIYIGFDADPHRYASDADLGMIVHLSPQDTARITAEGIAFPNGLVLAPDGTALVVAETMKPRLSAFDIGRDGSLGPRRSWGVLDPKRDLRALPQPELGNRPATLDGCAMDADGHVWAADVGSGCLRIAPGGAIVDAVFLPDGLLPFACALGGPDGRTLMICGADGNFADRTSRRESQLFVTRVDIAVSEPSRMGES